MTLTRTEKWSVFVGVAVGLAIVLALSLVVVAVYFPRRTPVQSDQAPMRLIASGKVTLAPGVVASGACTEAITKAALGTKSSDLLNFSYASDPTKAVGFQPSPFGMLTILSYPTEGGVAFKVCNATIEAVAPDPIYLDWRIYGPRP